MRGEAAQTPSAEVVLGVVAVEQPNVREREVTPPALALTLPLAIDVDLGHLHHVAHLQEQHTHVRIQPFLLAGFGENASLTCTSLRQRSPCLIVKNHSFLHYY